MIDYTISEAPSSSRNILLIHGLFGDKNNLNNLKQALVPNYNVMTIDLPDHGNSSHTEEWSFASAVEEIHQLLDQQNFYPCSIVGHSLGGKVAMAMALSHGEQVQGIVVADISPVTYPARHDNVFKALNAVANACVTSRKQASDILNDILVEPGVAQFLLKSFKKQNDKWQWLFNVAGLQKDYNNIIDWPYLEESYAGNVLFIKGGESDYIVQTHQTAIQTFFPRASFKVINGTGHWLHAEKPEVFNRLVLRMLNDGE